MYGEWLVLVAAANFAVLATLGLFQAAAVEIVLGFGTNNLKRAVSVFTTISLVGVVGIVLLLIVAAMATRIGDVRILVAVTAVPQSEAGAVLALAFATVLFTAFLGTIAAPLNASVGGALSTTICTLLKIFELFAITIVVLFGGGPVFVTAVITGCALLNVLIHVAIVQLWAPWAIVEFEQFNWSVLRNLIRPSLAQFLFYASATVLATQAPRILLGHFSGPEAVAIFSVVTTYVRSARTFITLLSHALQVEITKAFANRHRDLVAKLAESLCQTHLWGTFFIVVVLTAIGPLAIVVWTQGKIDFHLPLCLSLGIGAIIGSYADAVSAVLLSINRAIQIAFGHLLATVVILVIATMLLQSLTPNTMALLLILPEIAVAIIGVLVLNDTLSLRYRDFFLRSIQWPIQLLFGELQRVLRFLRSHF